MLHAGFSKNEKRFGTLAEYHPWGRFAKPEEVARIALFLASPQATFMTGAAVNIDGGISACRHNPEN